VSGETVEVKGNVDAPAQSSTIASKADIPLIETPRSVTIFDRRTLDDMAAINISQAHDYTVGVIPLDERGPASARGFPVDFYDLRRDGLRTYSWSVREPVTLDRIQYLRGPAAVLYGDGSPGGLVNLVLKKPLPVSRFEFSGTAGGLGFERVTADATGPLTTGRAVRYRATGAAEWLDNGFDNNERRLTFLPSFAFDLGSRATMSVDTELYYQKGRNYRHAVPATAAAQRGDFSAFPWDLSIASPDDGWTGWNIAPGARLDLTLSPNASVHVSGRYTRIGGDLDFQAIAGLSADGQTMNRLHYREISTWNEYQSDAFTTVTHQTGRLQHRLVLGVEAGLSTTDSMIGVGPASSINIHDPVYGPHPTDPPLAPTRYDVTRVGVYALDQLQLSKIMTVVPGVRWSRIAIDDKVAVAGREAESEENLVSPNIGIVLLPRPWLSLYSSFTRGFEPPAPGQYLQDGGAPALSENGSIEGGVKTDVFDRRLSVSGALFRLDRTNVPENDALGFIRQIGKGTSHGIEAEAVGLVAPGLSARVGYAWTKTEITRDSSGFVGRELPNAPRYKFDLWMRYRLPVDLVRGVMVSAGVVHVSKRYTARNNLIVEPPYTRIDASGSWELAGPRLTLGLAIENMTNVRYVTSGNGSNFIAGPSRRASVQLTSAF